MKILHVISSISPTSGGPTRSVKGLCRAESAAGCDVTLLVLNGHHAFENPCGVKVIHAPVADVGAFDLVHIHGLWKPRLHKIVGKCLKGNIKYVISPRGMLDPWALSVKKWKKRIALFLYQHSDLRYATAFHVTAQEELEHVRAVGYEQPCIVAPNAVDLPVVMPKRNNSGDARTVIFLSRLHPGKGLLMLAEAWARVHPRGWRMRVVGPDNYGHKTEVVELLTRLGIVNEWQFEDAMDDVQKWQAYRSADLLVHPSVSENFGITIAEGLAAGLPVICTKGTPWSEIECRKCGWWVDVGVEPLARALENAISLSDDERHEMGVRGRKLVDVKYTWSAVVNQMIKGYSEVLNERA